MKAFHDDAAIKSLYLDRVRAHAAADEIEKGFYWQDGRGCAVGCTVHGSDYGKYEAELGIPRWLAVIEDQIFEGLPLEEAKLWPERFLSAIAVGQDLEAVKAPFLAFVVADARSSAARAAEARAEAAAQAAAKASTAAQVKASAAQAEAAALQEVARTAAAAVAADALAAADAAAWSAAAAKARAVAWSAARVETPQAEAALVARAEAARAEAYSHFAETLIALIEEAANTKEEQKL
jgi:hypothetical protein